jgi:hypothetical protein
MTSNSKMASLVISLAIVLVGLIIVVFSSSLPTYKNIEFPQFAATAGSFLCSVGIFSIFFDIKGKNEIAKFVWLEAKSAMEARDAGIIGFTPDSANSSLPFDLTNAHRVISVSAYSSRFLKKYESDLQKCLSGGGKVTIISQSRTSPTITAMKALKQWDDGDIDANNRALEEIYKRLKSYGDIKLLYHEGLRAYSCTIIDTRAYMTFATNSNGRSQVPRITVQSSSELFEFLKNDAEKMVKQSNEI